MAIAAGSEHSLGLKSDRTIAAWGNNDQGLCTGPPPNAGFEGVAGGGGHSLGLKADRTVVTWGSNDLGQCAAPSPNAGFEAVAAGYAHSLGLRGGPPGACGLRTEDWRCEIHPPAQCASYQGLYQGNGTLCEPNPCPALIGVDGASSLVSRLQVLTAPNPSAGGLVIRCLLPLRSLTTVVLFDASGRIVRRLHDGDLPVGETPFSWDGRDDAGEKVGSGIYFYQLTAPGVDESQRMILLP